MLVLIFTMQPRRGLLLAAVAVAKNVQTMLLVHVDVRGKPVVL